MSDLTPRFKSIEGLIYAIGTHPETWDFEELPERSFDFCHKENHKIKHSLALGHGALLLMKGDLQRYWEHQITTSILTMKGRINLTFRIVI